MKTYLEINPARAKHKPKRMIETMWSDDRYVIEQKLDGWRYLQHFGGDLTGAYMTGRRVSKKTGKLSEKGMCAPMLWAPDVDRACLGYTVTDGEVMPPKGRLFADIAGIMNVEPEEAKARIAEIGPPRYVLFDLLFYDGMDLRGLDWEYRHQMLKFVLMPKLARNPNITLLPTFFKNKHWHLTQWLNQGYEGCVLKDKDTPYGAGWIKVKRFVDLDVVITGFTDAEEGITGKYKGLIGAVKVSVVGDDHRMVEVGQVSGMTDELRKEITAHKAKYLGTVLEIRAQEMAKDRLRHPRWRRWRPEASPKEATMAKLLADLKAANNEKEE